MLRPRINGLRRKKTTKYCSQKGHRCSWNLSLILPLFFLSLPIYTSAGNDKSLESPAFEPTASNVTAFEGQTVYLPCRVRNLGDKVVSWMRSEDLHIITYGDSSFSSDSRFNPQHTAGSDAWTLRLNDARKSDSGTYECQVNTEPKIKHAVNLCVRAADKQDRDDEPYSQQTRISYESTAPMAEILGPREQRVLPGSTITLRCVVTSPYQTRPIRGVQWLRDNKLLTIQTTRGGVNVETERNAAQTVSEITVGTVTEDDAGKYTCRPTEGHSDSIELIVERREHAEVMQRDSEYSSCGCDVTHWPSFLLPFAWFLIFAHNNETSLL